MKKAIIFICIFFSLISCKINQTKPSASISNHPIDLEILFDKNSIKNDSITFQIKNISTKNNYFFPLELLKTKSKENDGFKELNLFYPEIIFNSVEEKLSNKPYVFVCCPYYSDLNSSQRKNVKISNEIYYNSFDINKMTKIKINEILNFKMPIPPFYNDYFEDPDLNLIESGKFFGIQINSYINKHIDKIPKKTIDSLEQKGYKLYLNKINSNKMEIIVENNKIRLK